MENENKQSEDSIQKIRTFKTDVEIYLRDNKISKLDMAAKTYKLQQGVRNVGSKPRTIFQKILAYGIIFLAVLAFLGGGGYFAYQSFVLAPQVTPPEPESRAFKNLLAVDAEKELELSAKPDSLQLIEKIQEERQKNLRFNSIVYFKISRPVNDKPYYINSGEFLRILGWNAPDILKNNLLPDFNTLVFYGAAKNDLAVALRADNFAAALEGMLAWEEDLWKDWLLFLSEQDTQVLSRISFKDAIVQNNDARVLRNNAGEVLLAYSIFNRDIIVIATSEEALSLVLNRLIAIPPRI